MRAYAGPGQSQGFELSLASVTGGKSGSWHWHSGGSGDGQWGREGSWLLEKLLVEIGVLRNQIQQQNPNSVFPYQNLRLEML